VLSNSVNVSQVTVMCVQDPFVLDHNTTSNVSERLRSEIQREFQRACSRCRNFIGCDDIVNAEHAGIVELLSDDPASSVSSPAPSLQLALSPQQTTDENVASVNVPEETAHIQLFCLRLQDIAKPATAAATVPGHRVAETEHRVNDAVGTVSWYCTVVDIVKLMLADIFDMECVSRDQPSEQFDFQLNELLTARASHDRSSSVPSWQKVCNLTLVGGQDSQPSSARSTSSNDGQLYPLRKHLLPEDSCDIGVDMGNGGDASGSDSSQQHSGRTATKRHKASDSISDGNMSGGSAGSIHQLTVANSEQRILLSLDCSARSRLWVGRKKVRRQFLHFSDELKIQLEVSSALRKEIAKSDHTILEFELAIVRPLCQSNDELMLAVMPSMKTSKEFGCFITFFISLMQKLVSNITVKGPVIL